MSPIHRIRHLSIACILAAFSSCGDGHSGGTSSQWLHVDLRVAGGAPPAAFQATIARTDGSVCNLVCPPTPEAASTTERCTTTGFDVLAAGGGFDVFLRSSGNTFLRTSVAQVGSEPTVLNLQPLPAAQNTENYATRLDGEDCLAAATALAISIPDDSGVTYSVKFYIRDLQTDPKVYFQNTKKYPLHYDFAQRVLGVTGSANDFARDTYAGADRPAMGGTLVSYPSVNGSAKGATDTVHAPWTLNFFPSDNLTPQQARLAHRLIEERITCLRWSGPDQRLVYLPAGDLQESQAAADTVAFKRDGIGWMDHRDLFGAISQQTLNPGLAFGTLKRMTPEQLAAAVVSFRDILLLTRIPNELPITGGTITEEFQTPLSHVNVAARTRGTPNLAYPSAFADPAVSSLIGKLVRFEVKTGSFSLREATLDEAEAFWASNQRQPYVPTFDASMTGIPSFDQIGFSDATRVGVKAANLAELSHVLGAHAPSKGLAIPFHYYDAFMTTSRTSPSLCQDAKSDCDSSGRAADVCQRALDFCLVGTPAGESFDAFVARMLGDPSFNQDTLLREAVLACLRYLIEHTPVDPAFGALLNSRIAEIFQTGKVKIRSSTNCEDLPNFSGAGLYNSYAAHATGKDAADIVVRQVFSSVWSFRGFEERSFWNIDHRTVRMGCAINESFSKELANGVLITQNVADPRVYGMYVNVQKGENEVTNPTGGALPEAFSIVAGPDGPEVIREQFSSLSPQTPLLSSDEVKTLFEAATKAQSHFASLYGVYEEALALDMEFKLTAEHEIVFKQARPYTWTH